MVDHFSHFCCVQIVSQVMCLMSHQCFSCCFLLQLLACHKTKCKFLMMPAEKHKKQWQGTNFASTTAKVFFHGGEISTFSWFLKQHSKSHRQWQKQNTVQCCSWSPEWTNKQNKVWRNLCYPVVCVKKKERKKKVKLSRTKENRTRTTKKNVGQHSNIEFGVHCEKFSWLQKL